MVFGSSVGALNGAHYAGTPTIEGIRQLESIWRGLRRRAVFPVTWRTLLSFVRRRDFLVASEGLRQLIDTHLSYRNLEDAVIPIHVVATDILSGETECCPKAPLHKRSWPAPRYRRPLRRFSSSVCIWLTAQSRASGRCAWRATPHHSADRICLRPPIAASRRNGKCVTRANIADRAAIDQ